jgi:ubiquinone/menaquinone biosynthesis C-methylase UbiE
MPGQPFGRTMDAMSTITDSADSHESFQIPIEAAEFYEAAFVPAFFAQWAPILCDEAGIAAGNRVLDVACGIGIVARTAADRVAPDGSVTGLDLNEAMLTVARRIRPDIDYRQGDPAALPFPTRPSTRS